MHVPYRIFEPSRTDMENINNNKKALFYLIMFTMTLISLLIIGELFARLFITPETLPKPPPFSTIAPYKANGCGYFRTTVQ